MERGACCRIDGRVYPLEGITQAMRNEKILFGHVMHKRLLPRINAFVYGIYYWAVPLSRLNHIKNSFWAGIDIKTHGPKTGEPLEPWARNILNRYDLAGKCDGDITLVAMPKIMGYVFNPVSFWLCRDKNGAVRAVISEVRNTFGQYHNYLCAHSDGRAIVKDDILIAQKIFHVSPFLQREGHYEFRFDLSDDRLGIYIDFYDQDGRKKLITALNGHFVPMNKKSRARAFWRYLAMPQQAFALIHWQALKIISKGISYISLPQWKKQRLSASDNLNEKT